MARPIEPLSDDALRALRNIAAGVKPSEGIGDGTRSAAEFDAAIKVLKRRGYVAYLVKSGWFMTPEGAAVAREITFKKEDPK